MYFMASVKWGNGDIFIATVKLYQKLFTKVVAQDLRQAE